VSCQVLANRHRRSKRLGLPPKVAAWKSSSEALTPPQVLAAGQHAKPPFVVYRLHCPSPLQHTLVRPGPQLLAAGQQPLPLHATLPGHVCKEAQHPPSGQATTRQLQSLAPASGQVSQYVPATSLTIPGDPWPAVLAGVSSSVDSCRSKSIQVLDQAAQY
jgi:hypothetical protein